MFKQLICLCIFITLWLTSCEHAETNNSFSSYDSEDIQWISLSYSGHEIIREEIRTYLNKRFAWYVHDRPIGDEGIPTAIGLYDLNNDGTLEIIAFISHSELVGAKDSGALFVFIHDGTGIVGDIWLPSFPLVTSTLEDPNSRQIGIVRTETTWDELFVRPDSLPDAPYNGRSWNLESRIYMLP